MTKSTLIVGIGNIGRMDDGAGVHVVKRIINSDKPVPEDVDIIDAGCAVYDLLPLMMGRRKIIIVDAINVDDIPGSIYWVPAEDLRYGYWKLLSRSPELREIIFQLYAVSGDIKVEFVGIVPEDVSGCSLELTERVRDSLEKAVDVTLKAAVC